MKAQRGRKRRTVMADPMHLRQAVAESMVQTFQRGAMGMGEELAQYALRHNPRLKRLLNQYAEASLEQGLRALGVTPEK